MVVTVEYRDADALAGQPYGIVFGTHPSKNIIIRSVADGSAASAAGLKAGDLIQGFGFNKDVLEKKSSKRDVEAFVGICVSAKARLFLNKKIGKRGMPTKAPGKALWEQGVQEATAADRGRKRESREEASPEERKAEALRRRAQRESWPLERFDADRERKAQAYEEMSPQDKAARQDHYRVQNRERRSQDSSRSFVASHLDFSAVDEASPMAKTYVGDPAPRRVGQHRYDRYSQYAGHTLQSLQDPNAQMIWANDFHRQIRDKVLLEPAEVVVCAEALRFMQHSQERRGVEREVLDYDVATARYVNAATIHQEIHDEMLELGAPVEGPIVRSIMDWLGELLEWRGDLFFVPSEITAMGNPSILPVLPPQDPPSLTRPRTFISVVYVGSGVLGHYVTLAVCWPKDCWDKTVHVFDSLQTFTRSKTSPHAQGYRNHLTKVGSMMLGLGSTEGVRLVFHTVQQQSNNNSCAAFAILYAVALSFFVLPNDLAVPEHHERYLRRRLHDFLFSFPDNGAPSLNPLRRALEVASQKYHDDEPDVLPTPCPLCPDGEGLPIDLPVPEADQAMASLSISDAEEPGPAQPPPIATSAPSRTPAKKKKRTSSTPRKTYQKRKRKLPDLGSAWLPPLKRPNVGDELASCCPHCLSWLFAGEAGSKTAVKSKWCCSQGALVAPRLRAFESEFYSEGKFILPAFRDATRKLNNMASMASSGVSGRWVTFGGGTSFVKVEGRVYHRLHNLNDPQTRRPNQLCILNSNFRDEHARSLNVDPRLASNVFEFLYANNSLYREYRALGAMASTNASILFQKVSRQTHGNVLGDAPGRQQNLMPQADEITAIVSNDSDGAPREVRVWAKADAASKTISYLDPTYEALAYPLLRPHAEASWEPTMKGRTGRKITQQQFLRQMHLCQPRMWEMGRLGQEAAVDGFCRVEGERLQWVKRNQATLRMGTREEVARQLGEDPDGVRQAGRQIIVLPATFTNSPRQMRKLYHDAMRVVAAKGKPTFFVTFTCNPKWPEITGAEEEPVAEEDEAGLLGGAGSGRKRKAPASRDPSAKVARRPTSCPSVIARVFKLKLGLLMKDIRDGKVFGSGSVYDMDNIEFQQRGLPHSHILVRLREDVPVEAIDEHISARIPGEDQPDLRAKVLKHMVHGPCGRTVNPRSPCMNRETWQCTKRYPMGETEETHLDERGYPHYRRSKANTATIRRIGKDFTVDDTNIVPYSPLLTKKYDAHINVEYASTPRTVKYLFKYVLKGADRARAVVSEDGREVDEVQDYETRRMVGACEASWRLFGFHLHNRSINVIVLNVHAEETDEVVYHDSDLQAALTRTSKLTRYFNRPDGPDFDSLTFTSYYEKWNEHNQPKADSIPHPDGVHHITPQKRGENIARLNWINQGMTERFFLRLILAELPARSFKGVRTVAGVVHPTYHAAAKALGLAEDDKEFFQAIEEAQGFLTAPSLRSFFVTMLVGETRTPAPDLWQEFADFFAEDFLLRGDRKELAHERALLHLSRLLSLHARTLSDFGLPDVADPDTELARELNRYPARESQEFVDQWKDLFTEEQRGVIDAVLSRFPAHLRVCWSGRAPTVASPTGSSGLPSSGPGAAPRKFETLLLLAAGGCGKTAVLRFLAHHLRLHGEVVICCASTGIAATNLPGGTTAHSAFRLPFDSTDPDGTSRLSMGTQRADVLRRASLIVYDEIAMAQRNTYRAFQRLLQDLRSPCLRAVLLCGDYAQIPPVVKHGTKRDVLLASTRFIPDWDSFTVLRLTRNMRAAHDKEYSDMVQQTLDSRDELIDFVYPDLTDAHNNIRRAILSGTNDAIDAWNADILSRLEGQEEMFLSADSSVETGTTNAMRIATDILASFNENGVPPHRLMLKLGASVILMRNLNFDAALCNSVKGVVEGFSPSRRTVYIRVPKEGGAPGEGSLHGIPRITFRFSPAGRGMEISRRQFPLRLAFALTMNKSQGQTLDRVGVDLQADVFAHGQLYVVVSRVRDRASIRALTRAERVHEGVLHTLNVVYPELVGTAAQAQAESPAQPRPPSPEYHGGALQPNSDEEEF